MRVGITLPQYELEPGRDAVESFVRASAAAGYDQLTVYDHVLGVDVATRPGWRGPYNAQQQFHEALVLLGFVAGIADIDLVTSVLVLSQRSAVLVAKQAAEIDVLSEGRLRLGVGIGWNRRELLALGEQWEGRGARLEEQIEVMRRLWTEEVVHFAGRYHEIDGLGICPLPVQRPIPVWLGGGLGSSEVTFRRIGRFADGWMPNMNLGHDDDQIARGLAIVRESAHEAGRAADVELEGLVQVPASLNVAAVREQVEGWAALGATRVTLRTLDEGLTSEAHIEAVGELARALGLAGGRVPGGAG